MPAIPSVRDRWFAGITRNGVVLVALACLANALRSLPLGPGQDFSPVVSALVKTPLYIGLTMLAAVVTINRVRAAWRAAALLVVIPATTAIVSVVVNLIELGGWPQLLAAISRTGGAGWWFYHVTLRYGVIAMLFAAVFVFYRLREEHEAATQRAELDRARSEQQMEEARMQMLQAQIEPHFLFNTLANVRRLYQTDPDAGEAMLGNLMRYLSVALPQMRSAESTLEREVALAESYLEIQRMRMGRRLAFEIDIPAPLRDAAVPPMMLVTLVENAIKHGVGPLREGGFVRVSAHADAGELRLQVADSGQGFAKSSGGGTGLANIRARLAGLFGRAAAFTLAMNQPRGVVATIVLPYATEASGGAS